MKNRTTLGFTLLLLVQVMSATLYIVPNDEEQKELQAPLFEISSSSNSSSSPCGNNANYTYTYAYAPFMVMENQSFTTSSYVYCEILNATMMLDYSIVDSNNSTVYSGKQSWMGSNSSSSNYTWNVSGLSSGYYTFNAELYVDGTSVDSDYDSFMVYANTSGGGGSGGGGNYTSPCGNNANYSYVYAYAPYMVVENQSFTTTSYVYCEILNATMVLEYSIVDANNSTVYSGKQSWMGSNSSSSNYTWNVSGLSAGYYTFNADLYVDGTYVDTDYDSFMVYANTSGGGGSGGGDDGNNTDDNNTDDNNTDDNNTDDNNTDDNNTDDNNADNNNTDDNNADNNTTNNNNTDDNNTDDNNTLLDTDGDGIDDTIDNCQSDANLDQADTDGDGIGDACDDEIFISDDSNLVPSVGMLATSLCLLGAAVLVRRD